jgi:hypothetical protein
MNDKKTIWVLLLLAGLLWQFNNKGCTLPGVPSQKATHVCYVFNVRETGTVPGPVLVGLNRINREKQILADNLELPDEGETVPTPYQAILAAAKEAGLPSLVVAANEGKTIIKVVKNPTTDQAVWESVP